MSCEDRSFLLAVTSHSLFAADGLVGECSRCEQPRYKQSPFRERALLGTSNKTTIVSTTAPDRQEHRASKSSIYPGTVQFITQFSLKPTAWCRMVKRSQACISMVNQVKKVMRLFTTINQRNESIASAGSSKASKPIHSSPS